MMAGLDDLTEDQSTIALGLIAAMVLKHIGEISQEDLDFIILGYTLKHRENTVEAIRAIYVEKMSQIWVAPDQELESLKRG